MTGKKSTGRKPVDLVAAGPKPVGRDAVWSEIRGQRTFTVRSLRDATDIPPKTIRDYLQGLEAARIVERLDRHDAFGATKFKLIEDRGVHAPRVRKDGGEVEQGRATEAMWVAMRMLSQFSVRDLVLHASTETTPVTEVHAKDYCKHLAKARYLRVVKAGGPGKPAVYRFARFPTAA